MRQTSLLLLLCLAFASAAALGAASAASFIFAYQLDRAPGSAARDFGELVGIYLSWAVAVAVALSSLAFFGRHRLPFALFPAGAWLGRPWLLFGPFVVALISSRVFSSAVSSYHWHQP